MLEPTLERFWTISYANKVGERKKLIQSWPDEPSHENVAREMIHDLVQGIIAIPDSYRNSIEKNVNVLKFNGYTILDITEVKHQRESWHFQRDSSSVKGFVRKNRPSTDAMGAIYNWRLWGAARAFTVTTDEVEDLVVTVGFTVEDIKASTDLDQLCVEFGVICTKST